MLQEKISGTCVFSGKCDESPDKVEPMKFGETYATQVMFRSKRMDELARRCVDKVELIDYVKSDQSVSHFNVPGSRGLSKIWSRRSHL